MRRSPRFAAPRRIVLAFRVAQRAADATRGPTRPRRRPQIRAALRDSLARNARSNAPLDPHWGGVIDGAICSSVDICRSRRSTKPSEQAHYLATLWVGNARSNCLLSRSASLQRREATRISSSSTRCWRALLVLVDGDAAVEPISIGAPAAISPGTSQRFFYYPLATPRYSSSTRGRAGADDAFDRGGWDRSEANVRGDIDRRALGEPDRG